MLNHHRESAGHRGHFTTDIEHPNHNHDHLYKVGNRNRPHAAKEGVNQYAACPNNHAKVLRDGAIRHHIKDQAKRLNLRSNPAQIGGDDT